jgi:hypothetical protein
MGLFEFESLGTDNQTPHLLYLLLVIERNLAASISVPNDFYVTHVWTFSEDSVDGAQ